MPPTAIHRPLDHLPLVEHSIVGNMSYSSTEASTAASSNTQSDIGFTCRFTAGLRHVEASMVDHPLLTDDLACHLAGAKALGLAEQELATLSAQQGPGKHLRVPARSRLLDDAVKPFVQALLTAGSSCNVVALGAGAFMRSCARLRADLFRVEC